MIVKLKMCTKGKIFEEMYLKTIRDTFFPSMCILRIKPVIIKKSTFKFENVASTKLPKNINKKTLRKVITNLKWRTFNNFFRPLIKGNIKYTKSFFCKENNKKNQYIIIFQKCLCILLLSLQLNCMPELIFSITKLL